MPGRLDDPSRRRSGSSVADPGPVRAHNDGALLDLKVVPGARRDAIAGTLGDRLKVLVSAPPEGGRANAAVLRLLARRLGIPGKDLGVLRGQTSPEKTVLARGIGPDEARAALGL